MKYKIVGGNRLVGKVRIGGNKNAILPCMCAALLTKGVVKLENVPDIADVKVLVELIETLGGSAKRQGDMVEINCQDLSSKDIPEELSNKLRASVLLAGPMLSRFKKIKFHHPGGDVIGVRSLQAHFEGFERLGYEVHRDDLWYEISGKRGVGDIKIFMEEASVTAAENIVMAAVVGDGRVTVENCPEEPHIVDLCRMLNQMGAKIGGFGSSRIVIEGVDQLDSTTYRIGSDFVEFGTYAVAAVITGGEIEIENCDLSGWEPILIPMKKMGIEFEEQGKAVRPSALRSSTVRLRPNRLRLVEVKGSRLVGIPKLHTNIWPGFPSDMISIMIVLATQAEGVSLIHDWMYESRFFFVDKLIGMGARITIADPHRVLIYGKTKLVARGMDSPDIRAGMALVLAALIAEGESTISRAELVERGYEDVVGKLSQLGADISHVE